MIKIYSLLQICFDQSKCLLSCRLNISASHRSDIITGMVSSLSSSTDCQEASQLLWSLKRDILVSSDEMTPHVLPTLQACQHAVSDIKSSIANRPSYAVAAGALQLIAKCVKCFAYDNIFVIKMDNLAKAIDCVILTKISLLLGFIKFSQT